MGTAFCPECEEEVTLPSASAEAVVQCPLCDAEFGLSDLLDTIPPTLVVLSDPAADSTSETFEVADTMDLSGDEITADGDDDPGDTGFSFAEEEAPIRATMVRTPSKTPSHAGGGGMRSVVQVVLGGLLAIPLAQLALWYWPWGPQDPLDLGPKISKYSFARWAVPTRFQAASPAGDGSDSESAEPSGAPRRQNRGSAGERGGGGGAVPDNPFAPRAGTRLDNPSEADGKGFSGLPDSTGLDKPVNPTLDELSNGKPDEIKTGPVPLSPTEYVRGASKYQGVVLENMLERAQEQLARWTELPEDFDEKEQILEDRGLFLMLGQLASGFTFQDTDDDSAVTVLGNVFGFFGGLQGQQDILNVFNSEFERTIYENQAPQQGVILTATLSPVRRVNGYQQAEMNLTGSDFKIPLVYSPALAPDFESDKTYMVVGSLVRRPRRMLANYLGLEDAVVILGTYIPLEMAD